MKATISAKKGNSMGCMKKDRARRSRQELFFLSGGLIRLHLVTTVWVTKYDKNIAKMRGVEGRPLMQ